MSNGKSCIKQRFNHFIILILVLLMGLSISGCGSTSTLGLNADEFQKKFNSKMESEKLQELKIDKLNFKDSTNFEFIFQNNLLLMGKTTDDKNITSIGLVCSTQSIPQTFGAYLLLIQVISPEITQNDTDKIVTMIGSQGYTANGKTLKEVTIGKKQYGILIYEEKGMSMFSIQTAGD